MSGRSVLRAAGRTLAAGAAALALALALALATPSGPTTPITDLPTVATNVVTLPHAAPAAGAATVTISGLTPGTLVPGAVLTVTGTVRNTTRTPLGALSVDVRIRPERLLSRAAVAAWAAGEGDERPGKVVVSTQLPGRLAPGASATFSARQVVDASFGLPEGSASFGPRGVTVGLTGAPVPAGGDPRSDADLRRSTLGAQRTFTVWSPDAAPPTLRLGVFVPLVATRPVADLSAPDAATLADLAPTGRIGRLTRIGSATPGVTWAVDPALLLAAYRAGNPEDGATSPRTGDAPVPGARTTAPSPGPAPTTRTDAPADVSAVAPGAQEWLTTIDQARSSQDVRALPFGDPDLVALARAKQPDLLRAARTAGDRATRTALGSSLPAGIAWPVNGLADRATTDLVSRSGLLDLVLAGAAQPSTGPPDVTPLPRSSVASPDGRVGGLVADDVMSTAFTAAGRGGDALAQQRLVADLAATARESTGGTGRSVIIVAPRDWRVDGSSLSQLLTTLRTTSWLTVTPAGTMRTEPAGRTAARPLVYPPTARSAELDAATLRLLGSSRRRLTLFTPTLVDPDPVVRPLETQALSLVASTWRSDPRGLDARTRALGRAVDGLYGGVRIALGSSKNLLARTGNLPVTVQNDLDVAVRVVVTLRPRSGRLVVDKPVQVTVGARAQKQALVPVRAIADGDVDVDGSLLTPALRQISQPVKIPVRVRSDWENRGIAVVAGGLVLLLVVGLVRGVRRGRRPSVPLDTVPDPDDVGRVLVADPLPDPTTDPRHDPGADRTAVPARATGPLDVVPQDGAR